MSQFFVTYVLGFALLALFLWACAPLAGHKSRRRPAA
jgi:hypothetical protein